MYYWTPKRIKELKEKGYKLHFVKSDLTTGKKCDKENNYDKIQSKINRTRTRGSSSDTIGERSINRDNRE